MIFKHTPEDSLSVSTQTLLNDVENSFPHLSGKIQFVPMNLHSLITVEISDEVPNLNDTLVNALPGRIGKWLDELDEIKRTLHKRDDDEGMGDLDPKLRDLQKRLSIIKSSLNSTLKNQGLFSRPVERLGEYVAYQKKVILYKRNIEAHASRMGYNVADLYAYVYIHELFHAFFDIQANVGGSHYIREIEEAMAELGSLLFFEHSANNGNAEGRRILNLVVKEISGKKNASLSPYGFGYAIYEYYSGHKEPEKARYAILSDYAEKSSRIDNMSLDVIEYCSNLLGTYPSCVEKEAYVMRILEKILNLGRQQEMSFSQLYNNAKEEIKKTLFEKWEANGKALDPQYHAQIDKIIDNSISSKILVESMAPWQESELICEGGFDWNGIISQNLWDKPYPPFAHQVASWRSFLEPATRFKSIVATTGTGSGKTECFMVPLISDLAANTIDDSVQAIFLYPLNALMEDQKERLSKTIVASGSNLTFAVYNGNSPDVVEGRIQRLPHELVYRQEIRGEKRWDDNINNLVNGGRLPNILLTNPTMLEYMMLRSSDSQIVSKSLKNLSWIVIDETHTFTGAAADEIAMLLRRVLKAFDVDASQVHFATSSATIGKKGSNSDILKFIEGITGQKSTPPTINVIEGHREFPSCSLHKFNDPAERRELLCKLYKNDYIYLDDLIKGKDTSAKLRELDILCESGLMVKTHFFTEALVRGVFVDLKDIVSGEYSLLKDIPIDSTTHKLSPSVMQASYCHDCGAILANCDIVQRGTDFKCIRNSNNSANLIDGCNGAVGNNSIYVRNIAIFDPHKPTIPNVTRYCITEKKDGDDMIILATPDSKHGTALMSINSSCPCCGSRDVRSFAVSAQQINQALSPVLLDSAMPAENPAGHPYEGRQFVSFADSRKSAARPSMIQNLATERLWVYKKIYNLIAASQNKRISWKEALKALHSDPFSEKLAACFASKKDWDNTSLCLKKEYLQKYALGALYNATHRRTRKQFTAENYGLFHVYYPGLEKVTALPNSISLGLNVELGKLGLPIVSLNEWKNYLKIYLDYEVRENENLFFQELNDNDWTTIDISACRNLDTDITVRRSISPLPHYGDNRMTRLLCRLFGANNTSELEIKNPILKSTVENVLKDILPTLKNCQIIELGRQYRVGRWVNDKEDLKNGISGLRLNLNSIGFMPYESAYKEPNTGTILDSCFMGYSPYSKENNYDTRPVPLSSWLKPSVLPDQYAALIYNTNAPNLWCRNLEKVFYDKNLFIQLEHTAQIGREMTRSRINDFKDHNVNILSCSTTMEMGVDIGSLEIVSMSNIPPHPANYKQRAGRAGRARQNKSVCVTVCNSDSIGLGVLENPKDNLLERTPIVPTADLQSPQVVQRHINSFLYRAAFSNMKLQRDRVMDFFFNSNFILDGVHWCYLTYGFGGNPVKMELNPSNYAKGALNQKDYSAFHSGSQYDSFKKFLAGIAPSDPICKDLDDLRRGTCFEKETDSMPLVRATQQALDNLFKNLQDELEWLADASSDPALIWIDPQTNEPKGYARRLRFEFASLLNRNLMEFFCVGQFAPNANMPVNIVELKIDHDDDYSFTHENPSRDLRTALTEYTPGNTVWIDGKTYMVAGVDWNRRKAFVTIKTCNNCGRSWFDNRQTCLCGSSNISSFEMIEPSAFLPEEGTSRVTDIQPYSGTTKAKLLNSSPLQSSNNNLGKSLYLRSIGDASGSSAIAYFHEGIGLGFCVCAPELSNTHTNHKRQCGRSAVEKSTDNDPLYLRDLMYHERTDSRGNKFWAHTNATNTDQLDSLCLDDLRRNIRIGGILPTDYCVIIPLHNSLSGPAKLPDCRDSRSIIITLGVMICEELSKAIPCQRQDIDFIPTHIADQLGICIFDTSKGGAGFSKQLESDKLLELIFDECRNRLHSILDNKAPIESLFNNFTMRYLEFVDIQATSDWLDEEYLTRKPIPALIKSAFPNATIERASFADLILELDNAGANAMVFFGTDLSKWNYDLEGASTPDWQTFRRAKIEDLNRKRKIVFEGSLGIVPLQYAQTIPMLKSWGDLYLVANCLPGIHRLAYINGSLYVTDNDEYSSLNGIWAKGDIYAVNALPEPTINAYQPTIESFVELYIPKDLHITDDQLFNTVLNLNNTGEISNFIRNAQGHAIELEYTDEHIKKELSGILSLQFIHELTRRCNPSSVRHVISIEEYTGDRNTYNYDDPSRKLLSPLYSHDDIIEMLGDLDSTVSINKNAKNTLPHYRSLSVRDLNNGTVLTIKPHGGFANEWMLDSNVTKIQNRYISVGCGLNAKIPIFSTKLIQYTIGLR